MAMFDAPGVDELLAAVSTWLREAHGPAGGTVDAFQARVAANALDLVRRELALGETARAEARRRLQALLGPSAPADSTLDALQAELARRIHDRELTLASPGLLLALQQHTLAKMAIEQPGHALFRRWQAAGMPDVPDVSKAPGMPRSANAPTDPPNPAPRDGL
jgi:hypothetical protein